MPAHAPTTRPHLAVVLLLAVSAVMPHCAARASDGAPPEGRELAEAYCSGCHAIGSDDTSAHPEAPAFRTLDRLYPVEILQEALAEGIVTGHPDMPEVAWHPDTIAVFLAYLKSIQVP